MMEPPVHHYCRSMTHRSPRLDAALQRQAIQIHQYRSMWHWPWLLYLA